MRVVTARDRELTGRLDRLRGGLTGTPLVGLLDAGLDLYAKLEYCNPNGTSKDRSALWMLTRAIERGEVTAGSTVVESSSGNFALALASTCRALGLDFVPVIDPNCNAQTEAQLRMLCARVEKVVERDESGGYLGTRLARVAELRGELTSAYWPDQYANPDAMDAHYRLTGAELCRSLPAIDYLFVGVSTGGTIAGLSRRVKESFPACVVVAVDAVGSVIFGGPAGPRRIPGIGASVVPPLCREALIDDVVVVSERDAARGCRDLLTRHGLFAGGSTGSVYAAIGRYFADRPPAGTPPAVVFLCADRGQPYADTVYDDEWVAGLPSAPEN